VTSNKREPVLTLLDIGADFSIINPSLALRLRLLIAEVALPRALVWGSGSATHCYGAYLINWEATDSKGKRRQEEHIAYVIEHVGPPLILGMPALSKQAIVCDAEALS
jgi:hypothetical protein